jgi:hypothetical protein
LLSCGVTSAPSVSSARAIPSPFASRLFGSATIIVTAFRECHFHFVVHSHMPKVAVYSCFQGIFCID